MSEAGLQLQAGRLNLFAEAALAFRQFFMVEQNFREAEDRGQRRAQFMRHATEKERAIMAHMPQLAVGLFERVAALLQLFDEALNALMLLAHLDRLSRVADTDHNARSDEADAAQSRAQTFGENCDGDERADECAARLNRHGDTGAQSSLFHHPQERLCAVRLPLHTAFT